MLPSPWPGHLQGWRLLQGGGKRHAATLEPGEIIGRAGLRRIEREEPATKATLGRAARVDLAAVPGKTCNRIAACAPQAAENVVMSVENQLHGHPLSRQAHGLTVLPAECVRRAYKTAIGAALVDVENRRPFSPENDPGTTPEKRIGRIGARHRGHGDRRFARHGTAGKADHTWNCRRCEEDALIAALMRRPPGAAARCRRA